MTNISLDEGQSFFNSEIRQLSKKNYQDPKITVDSDNQPSLFVCPKEWCSYDSKPFADLELHMDIGLHDIQAIMKHFMMEFVKIGLPKFQALIPTYSLNQVDYHLICPVENFCHSLAWAGL